MDKSSSLSVVRGKYGHFMEDKIAINVCLSVYRLGKRYSLFIWDAFSLLLLHLPPFNTHTHTMNVFMEMISQTKSCPQECEYILCQNLKIHYDNGKTFIIIHLPIRLLIIFLFLLLAFKIIEENALAIRGHRENFFQHRKKHFFGQKINSPLIEWIW